ncbi:MAG: LA_3696 family protein [Desulfotomaculales bacterium]
MAVILHVPESLRQKLGEDGTKELIALIDQAARGLRENVSEAASERLERRIAEAKAEIVREIAVLESRLVWKMLAFLAGQTGVLYLLIRAAS